MSNESFENVEQFIYNVLLADKTVDDQIKLYANIADKYDEICEASSYYYPEVVSEEFARLKLPFEVKILDVGAGTGRNGRCLRSLGYKDIDALDGCEQMLKQAKERNIYNNYIQALVVKDKELPIPENSYDVALMAGSASPAHIDVTAYKQIIRVVKPGGIIGWLIEEPDICKKVNPRFRGNFDSMLQKFVTEKIWEPVEGYAPKRIPNIACNYAGDLFFYKVL